MVIADTPFIRACYGRNDGPIPVWIMRQAGRYLPEYRAVRERASFMELCKTPALIAEVVKQPIDRFNLDAAILFSDILTLLEPMGAEVSFPDGGPKIAHPIQEPKDVDRLHTCDIKTELPFVFEAIRRIKQILPNTPLIGFAGSPFTLACYLIEGQGSKNFDKAKAFLHRYPDASKKLFTLLTDSVAEYLKEQVAAGADAIQLFDSWGGILSREDYREWSIEPATKIFNALKDASVPRIFFVNNVAPYIDMVNDVPCEVVGVDYRMSLRAAMDALPGKAVQGNLDPSVLFGTPVHVRKATESILASLKDHRRLIFNLGHGIQPKTPIESVEAMVEAVKQFR